MTNEERERAVEHLAAVARSMSGDFTRITFPEGVAVKTADAIRAILSERAELLAAVERMRVALQPFAEVAEEFSVCGDGQPISIKAASGKSDLNVGHLRRAAEAAK